MVILCDRLENSSFPSSIKTINSIVHSKDQTVAILTNEGIIIKQNYFLTTAHTKPSHIRLRLHNQFIMSHEIDEYNSNQSASLLNKWEIVDMKAVSG